jgi:hypothetical protein
MKLPLSSSNNPLDDKNASSDKRKQRKQEKQSRRRNLNRSYEAKYNEDEEEPHRMNPFWFSQIDIVLGYWAMPWPDEYFFEYTTLSGAMKVILEALSRFLDVGYSLQYLDPRLAEGESMRQAHQWLAQEKISYPAYALNAQGG